MNPPDETPMPPELALAGAEPRLDPVMCYYCQKQPAEFSDQFDGHLCADCRELVEANPDLPLTFTPRPAFRIDSDELAEWGLRKLAGYRAQVAFVRGQAATWKGRIDAWAEKQLVKPLEREVFLEEHLVEYLRTRREADPKLKTLRLPSGEISSKTVPARAEVVDEKRLVEFLKDYCAEMDLPPDQFVRVQERPIAAGLKKILNPVALAEGLALLVDGDEVPGVEVVPGRLSIKVVVT